MDPSTTPDEAFDLYSIPAHDRQTFEQVLGKEIGSSKKLLAPGTVLLSKLNPRINRVGIVGNSRGYRQLGSSEWIPFSPVLGIDPSFLAYFLRQESVRAHLAANVSGVGGSLTRTNSSIVDAIPLPIPPLQEQKRIAESLEALSSQVEAAVASFERAQAKLKAYRKSVLKAAIEGRLVPTEAELARVENRDYEPADVLLKRILSERRRRWEQAELKKLTAAGKAPPDDRWKLKYSEPTAPDSDGLPELPPGWCWASWQQVGFSQNGRLFPSTEYRTSGIRLLRPGNLSDEGDVFWNEKNTRYLPAIWAKEYSGFAVSGGELVLNLTAQSLRDDFLGRACLTSTGERCLLNQRLARLTPIMVSERYMLWVLKSPWFRGFVAELNTGSLIQHMFTSQLDHFVLPLPPRAEQERIADEVERLVAIRQAVADCAGKSASRATRLRQGILQWAFEGKLVDQDPDDEPAIKLLDRIRADRAASAPPKKARGRKAKAAR